MTIYLKNIILKYFEVTPHSFRELITPNKIVDSRTVDFGQINDDLG